MRADHRTLGAKVDIGGVVPATRTEPLGGQLSIVGAQNVNGSGGTNVPKNGRGRASCRDVNRCPTTIRTLRKRGQLTVIRHRRTPRPPRPRKDRTARMHVCTSKDHCVHPDCDHPRSNLPPGVTEANIAGPGQTDPRTGMDPKGLAREYVGESVTVVPLVDATFQALQQLIKEQVLAAQEQSAMAERRATEAERRNQELFAQIQRE